MSEVKEKLARALHETIKPISDRPQRPDGINGVTWGDHARALMDALAAQGLAIVPLEPRVDCEHQGIQYSNADLQRAVRKAAAELKAIDEAIDKLPKLGMD